MSDERRRWPRYRENIFSPATFTYREKKYTGFMVDFSKEGAGFKIYGINEELEIPLGNSIEYEINTQFGARNCRGTTAWFNRDGNGYTWGIEYEEKPTKEDDPLYKMMKLAEEFNDQE